jgi:hypothetical protein
MAVQKERRVPGCDDVARVVEVSRRVHIWLCPRHLLLEPVPLSFLSFLLNSIFLEA